MRTSKYAAPICVALLPCYANALDLTLAAGYEGRYTDNAELVPDHGTSEWIHTPRAMMTLKHDGASVTATGDYMVSREYYSDNTYGNQTYAEGTARIDWRAIADRLRFYVANASTRQTIDARQQAVPTNEQVTNAATVGSILTVDSFGNQTIDIGYDYEWYTADQTDTDSQRQTGTVAYVIPLSDTRRIQLNGSYGDVNYDSSRSDDYKSKSGNLEFVNEGDHVSIDTSIGYTVFDRENQDDASATIGNFDITWLVSDITSLTASYERSMQDESINSTSGIPAYGESFTDNTYITTPYTLDAYKVGITTRFGVNDVSLDGYIEDQNYDGVQIGQTIQDQNTKGVALTISRAMRPNLVGHLYGTYAKTDFNTDDNQDTYRAGLRFDWTRWRRLAVYFGSDYEKRTSNVPTEEYTEWSGYITLMYTLIGAGR